MNHPQACVLYQTKMTSQRYIYKNETSIYCDQDTPCLLGLSAFCFISWWDELKNDADS